MDRAGRLLVVVENAAGRHTLTILPFVQIASGSALVCGFGYALRIRVIWLRLWAFGLYCTLGKAIANAGVRDSFGIAQPSGKPGEKAGRRAGAFFVRPA